MKSKKINYAIFLGVFLLMLLCNVMTDWVADDFTYLYDFSNQERIRNIFQIFGSMKAHALSMNGRLIPHFFAQLFLLLPKWVFNIINAAVFTVMTALMYKIACPSQNQPLLSIGIFAAVWMFSPVFGQAYLWVDGACNYLWGYLLCILFILPYIKRFTTNIAVSKPLSKGVFFILAFVMGAWSENASAAFICVAILLVLTHWIFFKNKPKLYEIFGILVSVLGYLTIYLAPAQWANKAAELSLYTLRLNFFKALEMYKDFTPVLIVFTVALVICIYRKTSLKTILISLFLLVGSLLSNFMMMLASYYDTRSSVAALILLLLATFILCNDIVHSTYKLPVYCVLAVLLLCSTYHIAVGVNDIYVTHTAIQFNVQTILENKQNGNLDIQLPVVKPQTKYSAAYGLRYLSADTADTWPNKRMARYYEVNSIIGKR